MQRLKFAIATALSLLLLWAVVRQLDVANVASALGRISSGTLVIALLLLALDVFFRTFRWSLMVRKLGGSARIRDCLGPMLAGQALNNVLPLRLGDVARAVAFSRQLGLASDRVTGTLLIERLLDVMCLCLLFILGLAQISDEQNTALSTALIYSLAGVSLGVLALFSFAPTLLGKPLAYAMENYLPQRMRSQGVSQFVGNLTLALERLGRRGSLLQLVVLTLLVWFFEALVFHAILVALNSEMSLMGSAFSLASGGLATVLPSAPGYIGTFDFFTAQGARAFGMGAADASLSALTVHLLLWLPITLLGLSWLAYTWRGAFTHRLRKLRVTSA